MKRFLRMIFILCVILAVVPVTKANAATLAELQQKFPNGAYWNHVAGNGHYYSNYNDVGSCNNPDGYSWSPCYSHSANAPTGYYDCNSFNGGMQCCGFARKLAFDAYGSYATGWTNYTYDTANNYMWNSLKPGDVLHYTGGNADATYGHWVFVIAVNGNAITVGECNVYNAPCQIRWGNVIYKDNIYAQRVCVAPYELDTAGGSNVSLITWTNSLSTPWETNAKVEIRANAPYSGSWGEVGVTVWDANGSVVAQKTEAAASDARTYLDIWYNITEEIGVVLKPNASYTYQFHVYFNGTRYESGIGNFTTNPCSSHTVTTISGTPATCTASGLTDGQKCSVCDLVLTEQTVIPAKGHSEVAVAGKAATCTESGLTDGKKCSVCGTVTAAQTIIKAKGHIYTSNMDIDCNVCGAEREQVGEIVYGDINYDGKLNINDLVIYDNYVTKGVVPEHYGEQDFMLRTDLDRDGAITNRDAEYTNTLILGESTQEDVHSACTGISVSSYPKTTYIVGEKLDTNGLAITLVYGNQKYKITEDLTVTGFDPNKIGKQTLTVKYHQFTTTYEVTVQEAHKHNHTATVVKPTCTESGYTQYTCTCGDTYKENYVNALGHKEVTVAGKAATCTKPGKTDGKKCSVCGTVTVKQKTIKAKGHTYTDDQDAYCNVCGQIRSVPMFRMYDPNSGEHFYSGSELERDFLIEAGWHYEGVGFNFPYEGAPVYRLYDPVYGEHLYTMDEAEMNKLLDKGWNYENVAFNSAGTDEVPQYRLHNPNSKRGAYHFTGSEEERDLLISFGWVYQGIGWYSCLE